MTGSGIPVLAADGALQTELGIGPLPISIGVVAVRIKEMDAAAGHRLVIRPP